jgi:predicted Zn-dependent peptidase
MIGTQADKALDALKVYMDLMNNMPEKPERMEDIRSFLIQTALTLKPSPRDMTWALEQYMLLGYTEDPAKMLLPEYRALTFDDVRTFYQKYVKNKPIAIGILGDKKQIDAKELKNVGKVVNLSPSRLFN